MKTTTKKTTATAALNAGLRTADIRWDLAHGLIAVTA